MLILTGKPCCPGMMPLATRPGDICWHMVEEELQHRGEINALLWQMDIDPRLQTTEIGWMPGRKAIYA